MKKNANQSVADGRGLSVVLADYLEEAEVVQKDDAQLRHLRERYVADHEELAAHLQSHFEEEDLIQGRVSLVGDASPEFERYTSITPLGEGGQAIVLKAYDQKLKTWVALKMSKSAHMVTAAEAERFRFEAQSMAQLKHPNVVRVFDVKDYQGRPFVSMEFISGGSLAKHLDRFVEDPRSAAELMVNVSRAVHHAHQRRILHRDLKPSNVLLDTDRHQPERPCVSDFGLAKPMDVADIRGNRAAEPESDITSYGKIVGTASYMSPEQANGRDVTTLSDVYGLGSILYALQTAEPPFRADSVGQTLQLVRDPLQEPRPPRELNPGVDHTLEAICLKCLRKNPLDRYRSAEGLAKDLDRWLAHMPTEARPPKPAERLRLWCRRNPVGLGLAAVLVALVTLAGLNVLDRLQEPRRAQATLARQQAETLEIRLQQLTQAVAPVAENPRLGELLVQRNRSALQTIIEATGNSRVDLNGSSPFESWFVIDRRDGAILARWPEMSPDTEGVDFSGRDYFERVNDRSGAYVSQVFKALSDDLYKFGISTSLQHNGENVGIVVATVTTSRQMGLPGIEEPGFVTALLARRDSFLVAGETGTSPEGASDFVILLHPGYERGIEPEWFPEEYLSEVESRFAEDYRDPVASLHEESEEYGGRWLASFAPVAGSEFVVLVQRRYAPVVPGGLWLVLILLFAVLLLTVAIKYLLPRSTGPAPV